MKKKEINSSNVEKYTTQLDELYAEGKAEKVSGKFITKNKEQYYLYIGRKNCKDCRAFMPELYEFLKNNDLSIKVYNSEELNKDEPMKNFIKEHDLLSVPVIIKMDKLKLKSSLLNKNEDIEEWFLKNRKEE